MILQLNNRPKVLCFRLIFFERNPEWCWPEIKNLYFQQNQTKKYFLQNSDSLKSAAWIKANCLLLKLSSANGKFLNETLFEEIITVVNDRFELGFPDKSKQTGLSSTKVGFPIGNLWNKSILWLLRNKCSSFDQIIINSTFNSFLTISSPMRGKKIHTSPTKQFTTKGNYPNENLIRKLNLYFYRKVSFKIKKIHH